ANPADYRGTVAAGEGIGDFAGTVGAIESFVRLRCGICGVCHGRVKLSESNFQCSIEIWKPKLTQSLPRLIRSCNRNSTSGRPPAAATRWKTTIRILRNRLLP